jgi:hypothetical protein
MQNFPTPLCDYHRTGVSEKLPCGCVVAQFIEIGTSDYHECWAHEVLACEHHKLLFAS